MAYAGFNGNLKKINLKPKGIAEIVLEIPSHHLDGHLESLASMVDTAVKVDLESVYTSYMVKVNRETERPIIDYKVDQSGVVHEVKPEGEQIEMFENHEVSTRDEERIATTEIIDQFIESGLAPTYDDLSSYDFVYIMRLHLKDGVSYRKIASDFEIASSKLADVLDEYRSRVAPLAEKWWEWKQQPKVDPQIIPENKVNDTDKEPEKENQNESDQNEQVDDTQSTDGYGFDDEEDESIFDDHEDEKEDGNSAGAA